MLANGIVDKVLTTGGVANVFLAAKGIDPGAPTTEFMRKEVDRYDAFVTQAKELLAKFPGRIEVPIDLAVNDRGTRRNVHLSELPSDHQVYDVGLDTIVNDAVALKYTAAPLTKEQLSELIQIPPRT